MHPSQLARTPRTHRARRHALATGPFTAAAIVLMLTLGACSSSGGTSSGSGKLSGKPVKVLVLIEDYGSQDLIKAGDSLAEKAINAQGGIDGRPLQIVTCEHQSGDKNTAGACVSKALADPDVVAAAGFNSTASAVTTPLITKAGLACLGCVLFGPADFSSKSFFPVSPGFLTTNVMSAIATKYLHVDSIALPYNSATGGALPGLVESTTPKSVKVIKVPITTAQTDLSSPAANMLSQKPGAIVAAAALPLLVKLMAAVEGQGGANIPLVMYGGDLVPGNVASQLPGVTNSIIMSSDYNRSGAGFAQFESDLKKYSPDTEPANLVLQQWIGIKMLFAKQVVPKAGSADSLTRQSVFNAANSLSSVNLDGLTPTLDFTKPSNLLGGTVTRAFNTTSYVFKIDGEKFTPAGSVSL